MGKTVTFDNRGVTFHSDAGPDEYIGWSDLSAISVETTDAGPFAEDVFFVLRGGSHVCRVPQGAAGVDELLVRLQGLPGFDNEPVIAAMSSTVNAGFPCWSRAAARPVAALESGVVQRPSARPWWRFWA